MEIIWNMGISLNILFQSFGIFLKTPMEIFSFFGTEVFFLLLLPALYWCIESGIGLRVGIILLLSVSLNESFKLILHGPRPYWYSSDVISYANESSFGVPSGHSQTAIAVWGMLASEIGRKWAWMAACFIIMLIGISRIYLGVHFPHDVIIGWLIGAFLLWLVLHFWKTAIEFIKKMSVRKQIWLSFLSSMVLILLSLIPFLWLKISHWQMPQTWEIYTKDAISMSFSFTTAGMLFGFLSGLMWIRNQGGFSADGNPWKRILRYILGMTGLLILYFGLKAIFGFIFPEKIDALQYFLRYIRYYMVGIWISACAPWIFIKLNLALKAE